MSVTIRKATESDALALSRICLLTADAGASAEHLHDFGELPGLVYAVPYVKLSMAWGFVLVEESSDQLVGYIVGSKDTRLYERDAAEYWWPALAEKYPSPSVATKPADKQYLKLLRAMHTAPDANIAFGGAHLHINIVEKYQGKGWGRKLIATAIEYLKKEEVEGGVWVGLDVRNENAKKFYERLGFAAIEGAPDGNMGLNLDDFKG